MAAKNIVLCIDGTWNARTPLEDTNVRKLFESEPGQRHRQDPPQVCCYLPGVGEDMEQYRLQSTLGASAARVLVKADAVGAPQVQRRRRWRVGAGHGRAHRGGYHFLCRNYQKGRQGYHLRLQSRRVPGSLTRLCLANGVLLPPARCLAGGLSAVRGCARQEQSW